MRHSDDVRDQKMPMLADPEKADLDADDDDFDDVVTAADAPNPHDIGTIAIEKGKFCRTVMRPLFYYMSVIGLNHSYLGNHIWRKVYNFTVIAILIASTIRKFSQLTIRTPNKDHHTIQSLLFDPAVALTLCHALFLLCGTSAALMLLRMQFRRKKLCEVLENGIVKCRKIENDICLIGMNRLFVGISTTVSFVMGITHMLVKMEVIRIPWSPPLITSYLPWVIAEAYVVFIAQSAILMLATLFAQICLILRTNVRRLVIEMVPPDKDTCPTTEQALQQIHEVQKHYQSHFSMAIFYTYAGCIPIICFLSYILCRDEEPDFAKTFALSVWMANAIISILIFSIPAFIVQEHGANLLTSCFRMYHETLCEHRDVMVLSAMQFLTIQIQSTELTLTAGNFFYLTRRILLTLVSAICTYFLVLIQFDSVGTQPGSNITFAKAIRG